MTNIPGFVPIAFRMSLPEGLSWARQEFFRDVRMEARSFNQKGDPASWTVSKGNMVLSRGGKWEPWPLSPDSQLLARTSFTSTLEILELLCTMARDEERKLAADAELARLKSMVPVRSS